MQYINGAIDKDTLPFIYRIVSSLKHAFPDSVKPELRHVPLSR